MEGNSMEQTPMIHEQARTNVQERLLDLAGVYRKLNRKELAHALGRDGSKLAPSNGNPKLDYLVALADILDWPIGDVAEVIWGAPGRPVRPESGDDFEQLDAAAREAHSAGDYQRMCDLAQRMRAASQTPDQRALAALREAGSWDGRGRYMRQLEVVRRGLQEGAISADLRLLLQSNLANAHYTLGSLFEARALAGDLIGRLQEHPPATRRTRASQAFAYYVYGNACREMAAQAHASGGGADEAGAAHGALQRSIELYTELADEFDHEPWRGIANTCRGGLVEVEVAVGCRSASEALAQISEEVESGVGGGNAPLGDRLESYGWWCIFGCNIALSHLDGREQQQYMTALITRGNDVASRLNNWSMRERLFTMEYLQRRQLDDLAGFPVGWAIDEENIRLLVGTMGRFPSFRCTGWQILQSTATIK